MMSLFSSFDALLGESYGYKFKFSVVKNPNADSSSLSPSSSSSSSSSSVVRSVKKDGEDNSKTNNSSNHNGNSSSSSSSSSSSPPSHVTQVQKQRRPRFAPELDGVHCFETIILY